MTKLSPKRNGKGYLTSWTVSIGSAEAKDAGFVGKELVKTVEPGKITIEIKQSAQ